MCSKHGAELSLDDVDRDLVQSLVLIGESIMALDHHMPLLAN